MCVLYIHICEHIYNVNYFCPYMYMFNIHIHIYVCAYVYAGLFAYACMSVLYIHIPIYVCVFMSMHDCFHVHV